MTTYNVTKLSGLILRSVPFIIAIVITGMRKEGDSHVIML